MVAWPWVREVRGDRLGSSGQMAKGFRSAKELEFYPGSHRKAWKVLRHRCDDSGDLGFDWLEPGGQ